MEQYIALLRAFLNRSITAQEFERAFLDMFESETSLMPGTEFNILDRLFGDVDGFCADPDLIDDPRFDVSEDQLRASAVEALNLLSQPHFDPRT